MEDSRKHSPPKSKPPRSFTFIDQKTHLLPRNELASVRRHISTEASQRRRRKPGERQRSTAIEGLKEREAPTEEINDDKRQSENSSDPTLSKHSQDPAQGPSDNVAPMLNTYLAGGRIDSLGILALAAEKSRELELMDYIINVIWPGFCEKDNDGTINPYPRHWLQRSSKNPALLHGFMYSSSSHVGSRLFSNTNSKANNPKLLKEQLYHQAVAVKALREQLESIEGATPEDIADCVMTILCLATNQRQDMKSTEPDETPFNPPLAGAAWLNIYGIADFSEMHWQALVGLVKANYGLARMAVFGLPWVISYADILLSTASLQKPAFQTFDVHGMQRRYTPHKMFGKYPALQNNDSQGTAFLIFLDWGFEKHYVQPFLHLADFSTILAAYYHGILTSPNISEIASDRNVVQHQLLSLPTMLELVQTMDLEEEYLKLYESCRLAALLYAIMVTFPIPRSNNVRETLLRDLKRTIILIDLSGKSEKIVEVCLWCLVVGGIAALSKPELPWYVEQTKHVVKMLGLRKWKEVEGKLFAFAWLKSACSAGGVKFWTLVKDDEIGLT